LEFGSVVGVVDAPRSTQLSLIREAVVDTYSIIPAILDTHSRLLRPA